MNHQIKIVSLCVMEVADGLDEVAVQGKFAFVTGASGLYVVDIANLKGLRIAGVCAQGRSTILGPVRFLRLRRH